MIILEGPNTELRAQLYFRLLAFIHGAENLQDQLERTDLQHLVRFVHQDLRHQVVNGWPIEHLEENERHLLMNALLPQAAIYVICDYGPLGAAEVKMGGVTFPIFICAEETNLDAMSNKLLATLDLQLKRAKLFEDLPCSGSLDEGAIMLVGEACQYIAPRIKRRAFISHKGCSLFLQEAIRRAASEGHRFYLTNAQVTGAKSYDRLKLQLEIDLIKPKKIIALGAEAAAVLADQGVNFERTWHPSYWAKFRANKIDELVEILKS